MLQRVCTLVLFIVFAAVAVGLTEPHEYRVEEGSGIRVCASLMTESGGCIVQFPFFVIFNTRDGTGKGISFVTRHLYILSNIYTFSFITWRLYCCD